MAQPAANQRDYTAVRMRLPGRLSLKTSGEEIADGGEKEEGERKKESEKKNGGGREEETNR